MKHACEEMSQLSSERLERKLDLTEQVRLKLHTLMCGACRHYDKNISKLHQALYMKHRGMYSNAMLPQDQREKIKSSLQKLSSKS